MPTHATKNVTDRIIPRMAAKQERGNQMSKPQPKGAWLQLHLLPTEPVGLGTVAGRASTAASTVSAAVEAALLLDGLPMGVDRVLLGGVGVSGLLVVVVMLAGSSCGTLRPRNWQMLGVCCTYSKLHCWSCKWIEVQRGWAWPQHLQLETLFIKCKENKQMHK